MSMTCNVMNGKGILSIEPSLTIFSACDDKNSLINQLFQCDELEVDLSRIEEIDTAGCQLLLLLKREADAIGKPIRFTGHSPVVLDVWDIFDLAGHFGDPLVITRDEPPLRDDKGGRMADE